jgi:magnesium chelatase subunit D
MDYPFTALVGQEQLKTALLLNVINPGIGGVLIRGEKGTAKSTAARALAALLPPIQVVSGCPFHCDPLAPWAECPHCSTLNESSCAEIPVPFIDLPLGATEDRVLGTLDLERALREGRWAFQPGLLAAAHRGILYIDEVNLLADHLVDVLLDAAAMGVNTVQREGIAVIHPAHFILIGTMNPEEGDLRPQLLDRFGLMVEVLGPHDPVLRTEIVRRRIAFEADPVAFALQWVEEQNALQTRIATARDRLPQVTLDDGLLTLISHLCCAVAVDGLRADIGLYKTARTLAALDNRTAVTVEDIRAAAALVLPHRRRRQPFEQPGLEPDHLDDLLSEAQPPRRGAADPASKNAVADTPPEPGASNSSSHTHSAETSQGQGSRNQLFEPTMPPPLPRITVAPPSGKPHPGRGRRNAAMTQGQGHYVRAVPDENPTDLALDATMRAAARRSAWREGQLAINRTDLHQKERTGRVGTLILFVVDASGSMGARRRMEAVKGAVLSLLLDAYQQRDQVGVIAFRGPQAEVLLSPTNSVDLAERALRALPTGGRTPLAHALLLAAETIQIARRAHPDLLILLILLSDGKANVCLPETSGDPWQQALQAATLIAAKGVSTLVLDTEANYVRMSRASELARALAAKCLSLEHLSTDMLVLTVRQQREVMYPG